MTKQTVLESIAYLIDPATGLYQIDVDKLAEFLAKHLPDTNNL